MQLHKHMLCYVYGYSDGIGNLAVKYVLHLCHIAENVNAHLLKDSQYDTWMFLHLPCPGREMHILLLHAQWWFPNSSWKLYCAVMAL